MKSTKLTLKVLLSLGLLFISCEQEDPEEIIIEKEVEVEKETEFTDGIFISAEGNFGSKDGSVSFLNNELSTSTNFIYNEVNDQQLGGLIQSIAFGDEYAYVILNDANQIVVINKLTFEKIATIETGLSNPRYMAIIGDKGYVTNWGDTSVETDDYVAIINLEDNTYESNIAVDLGPEQIINVDGTLYVSHKGAFTTNNVLSVISDDAVTKTITVNGNPDEMILNSDGDLIVLSEGGGYWSPNAEGVWEFLEATVGAIHIIDTTTETVTSTLEFEEGEKPNLLALENGNIYYNFSGEGVCVIAEDAETLSKEILYSGNFYGMNVKDDNLYGVSYAFTSLSKLSVFDTETATVKYETAVGLGASKVYFTE